MLSFGFVHIYLFGLALSLCLYLAVYDVKVQALNFFQSFRFDKNGKFLFT